MPARITPLAILLIAVFALAFPAGAAGVDDDSGSGSGSGIPVLTYDFDQETVVPVAGAIMLFPGSVINYYGNGKSFVLRKGMDMNGKIYVVHMSYAPQINFAERNDLKVTKDALKKYCKANGLKSDGPATEAVTEQYRRCNAILPDNRLTALLYPVEPKV